VLFFVLGCRGYARQKSWLAQRTRQKEPSESGGIFKNLQEAAARTGLEIQAVHLIIAAIVGALIGAGAGLAVTGRTEFALVGVISGIIAPSMFTRWQIEGRKQAFEMQLEQCLLRMASAMRAGLSAAQAIEETAKWVEPPAREVLGKIVTYVQTGHSLARAVEMASRSVDSKELELVASSIGLHLQVGGDLAEVFEQISNNIKEKRSFRARLAAATAEGRLTTNVLALLPFVGVGAMRKLSPEYMYPLFNTGAGMKILLICSATIVLGWGILKRIASGVEY